MRNFMTSLSIRLAQSAAEHSCGANDDTHEALEHRLAQFREHTLPVAHHYREKGLLKEVDVTAGRDAVFNRLYLDLQQEEVPA